MYGGAGDAGGYTAFVMRVTKLIAIIMVICNLIVVAPAQRKRSHRVERDVRIRKHHPTVYITFEGFGKVGNSLEARILKTKELSRFREQGKYIWGFALITVSAPKSILTDRVSDSAAVI